MSQPTNDDRVTIPVWLVCVFVVFVAIPVYLIGHAVWVWAFVEHMGM